MGNDGTIVQIPGSQKEYRVPINVRFSKGMGSSGQANSLICESGTKMAHRFTAEASLTAQYAGVSASASAQYDYGRVFKVDSLYGMYSFNQETYHAFLADAATNEFLNQNLTEDIRGLPQWDPNTSFEKYSSFFEDWGTHLIVRCTAGTRYQLCIEKENMKEERKTAFAANINFEYKGIVSAEAKITNQLEYDEYRNTRRYQCKVLGGNPANNGNLAQDPTDKDKFIAWQGSRRNAEDDAIVNMEVQSIGQFLKGSRVPELKDQSLRLIQATEYLSKFRKLKGVFSAIDMVSEFDQAELKVDAPPGINIKATSVSDGWEATSLAPNHLKFQHSLRGSTLFVDVEIYAPMVAVDVTAGANCKDNVARLALSPTGGKYRTIIYGKGAHKTRVPRLDEPGKWFAPPANCHG
ncbi:uncharacterized protein N7484_006070 [Penicillium longicatenatum]|uniref:uncharacterized protein n=1 Tax=Penicillium longicatenatum TaxID=1561947 RepID=UPI002547F05F|nr:uncharacterized protein N7484_006070 [Penicillium longicatenatum]KAJ5643563.1 hypothetical protein N7484_006070 [Penicillium longicatenatum]